MVDQAGPTDNVARQHRRAAGYVPCRRPGQGAAARLARRAMGGTKPAASSSQYRSPVMDIIALDYSPPGRKPARQYADLRQGDHGAGQGAPPLPRLAAALRPSGTSRAASPAYDS